MNVMKLAGLVDTLKGVLPVENNELLVQRTDEIKLCSSEEVKVITYL